MKKVNTKKKSSAKMKLIPAAGSLMISAAMLSTSTFAWFTMSREVEVKNIKMTASVPEDIQISLGHLQYVIDKTSTNVTTSTVAGHTGLAGNEGILTPDGEGTADDGAVKAPNSGNDNISMLDWANTADVSAYYQLGKIMPASSTTGLDIMFTPDAAGVGKSLKTNPAYYYAAKALVEQEDNTTAVPAKGIVKGYKTKLHANTSGNDNWSTLNTGDYTPASAWDVTNHDGYYVDIPVWLRTSSTDGANLAVDAYVTTNAAKDDDDLYLAARAVVLYDSNAKIGTEEGLTAGVAGATPNVSSGLIEVKQDSWDSYKSVVDFMTTTNATGEAVQSVNETTHVGTYGTAESHYTGSQIIKLPKSDGSGAYGAASKVIVRVWLEGEDPNCWNQNAGQDFNICLKFTKDALTQATAVSEEGVPTPANANYAKANTFTAEAADGATSPVKEGDIVNISIPVATGTYAISYHVVRMDGNNPVWEYLDGSYHVASAGKKHTIKIGTGEGTVIASSENIIAFLNANLTKKSDLNSVTVTEVNE